MYKGIVSEVHPLEKGINIAANRHEFGDYYDNMRWINPADAAALENERKTLLHYLLNAEVLPVYNNTKLDGRSLSPGCIHCAAGEWSCLFINNKCNASCFYCPTQQDEISDPATNNFTFESVEDYIHYLEKFQFKACSLSGGEPFLTFDKSLHFVKSIKQHFGNKIYMWLYTNGILSTEEKLHQLAEAGLDEIRFDIGATGYRTDKVKQAVGIIPCVTVEIPAVPGEFEIMKGVVIELAQAGVNHLNLHQLRCTLHNREKLIKKGFTFMHGPKVLVAGSEVAALQLMMFIQENNILLPVNYCSFVFKNSHQNKASRRRGQDSFLQMPEIATRAGFVRSIAIHAPSAELTLIQNLLIEQFSGEEGLWRWQPGTSIMYVSAMVLPLLENIKMDVKLSYFSTVLLPSVTYRSPFKELSFKGKNKIIIEKNCVMRDFLFKPQWFHFFKNMLSASNEQAFLSELLRFAFEQQFDDALLSQWIKIKEYEFMKQGLQPYY